MLVVRKIGDKKDLLTIQIIQIYTVRKIIWQFIHQNYYTYVHLAVTEFNALGNLRWNM